MEIIKPSQSKDTGNNALKIFWLPNTSVIAFFIVSSGMNKTWKFVFY